MATITPSPQSALTRPSRLPLVLGGCGVIVVVVSVLIGVIALPVLAGLVFPPLPPVPPGAVQIAHEPLAYGVDVWTYSTPGNPCDLVSFFAGQGGMCVMYPMLTCDGAARDPALLDADVVCTGEIAFSQFVAVWEARLNGAEMRIHRAVNWSGNAAAVPSQSPVPPTP